MKIKTTMKYHFTLIRIAKTQKSLTITRVCEDVENLEPSYPVGGIIK